MRVDRRHFLTRVSATATASMTGLACLPTGRADQDVSPVPIVDTHQHLWDLKRFHLPWLDPQNEALEPIRRNFLIPDYQDHTAGLNVVRTIYMEVNVSPEQQQAEADYVIDLCRRRDNSMVGAVIGGSPHAAGFADYIVPLAGHPEVKGVRTVLHDPDRPPGLCLQSTFVDGIRRLGDLNLNFDLCMRPGEIGDAAKLAAACPHTRLILDHCGNPGLDNAGSPQRKKWQDGVRAVAQQQNTFVKISGIVASVDKDHWSADDLAPIVNFCLDAFGENRCVFGGDWPVCLLGASFREWVAALKEIVKDRSPQFQRKLFHDNAIQIYRLS